MRLFPDAIGAGGLLRPGLRKVKERVWGGYGDFTGKVLQYRVVMGEVREGYGGGYGGGYDDGGGYGRGYEVTGEVSGRE